MAMMSFRSFFNTFKNDEGSTEAFLASVTTTLTPDMFRKLVNVDNTELCLEIWDTSGEERFCSPLVSTFYRKADAAIVMYDVTRPSSLREVYFWADQARTMSGNENLMLTLVGNKVDQMPSRRITRGEGTVVANKLGMDFYEASSRDKLSVDHVFLSIARKYAAAKRAGVFHAMETETEAEQALKLSTSKSGKVRPRKKCC
ncbi:ras-related protein RabQ-like isoform X2 [Ornithodoros turicata]|uniref:ras-related protein RabQ-like isoform X2 n=1 Tax=Ornithodoros turicata TaxID=34597 RepID=UPI003139EC21